MPRLGNILIDSDELTIPTPDGDIHIEYYPSRVTQKMANQFKALGKLAQSAGEEEAQDALHKIYKMLLYLIKSWDLEDEVPCGKCDICKMREKEMHYEEWEEEVHEACQSKEIIPFPLDAKRMNDLPVWLIVGITEALVGPNSKAPQKIKKNSKI